MRSKAEQRIKHIQNLAVIFKIDYDKMKAKFATLKAIEMHGRKAAIDYCNGYIDSEGWEKVCEKLGNQLMLMGIDPDLRKNLIFNGDARGYFLKISDEYTRANRLQIECDWGGYGIICPEGL